MSVEYERDCETVTVGETVDYEDGEVVDHYHADTYAEVAARAATQPEPGCRHEVVLVRDDDAGRSWAYVIDGKLPECFMDANGYDTTKVPQRFVRELAKVAA